MVACMSLRRTWRCVLSLDEKEEEEDLVLQLEEDTKSLTLVVGRVFDEEQDVISFKDLH